jgi:hypothetical protein
VDHRPRTPPTPTPSGSGTLAGSQRPPRDGDRTDSDAALAPSREPAPAPSSPTDSRGLSAWEIAKHRPYGLAAAHVLKALERGGYRVPAPGAALRVAFVGQTTYFESCVPDRATPQLDPAFVEFRAGAEIDPMLRSVEEHRPHVVFVFRPELIPPGLFGPLRAIAAGYFTEPLPRPDGDLHPDLGRRLGYMKTLDASNFDRLISFDPLIAEAVHEVVPSSRIWRSFPLPVADYLFSPVRRSRQPPRALFIGRSTDHREVFLEHAKHQYDLLHIAHGVSGRDLRDLLERFDVSINIHNERYPSFENRVSLSLAAGMLVLSEPLSPTHGLEPGIDYVEVAAPPDLNSALFNLTYYPDIFHRVRVRGRMKAEQFRASRVYPRIIGDLLLDLATFGSSRRPEPREPR